MGAGLETVGSRLLTVPVGWVGDRHQTIRPFAPAAGRGDSRPRGMAVRLVPPPPPPARYTPGRGIPVPPDRPQNAPPPPPPPATPNGPRCGAPLVDVDPAGGASCASWRQTAFPPVYRPRRGPFPPVVPDCLSGTRHRPRHRQQQAPVVPTGDHGKTTALRRSKTRDRKRLHLP